MGGWQGQESPSDLGLDSIEGKGLRALRVAPGWKGEQCQRSDTDLLRSRVEVRHQVAHPDLYCGQKERDEERQSSDPENYLPVALWLVFTLDVRAY